MVPIRNPRERGARLQTGQTGRLRPRGRHCHHRCVRSSGWAQQATSKCCAVRLDGLDGKSRPWAPFSLRARPRTAGATHLTIPGAEYRHRFEPLEVRLALSAGGPLTLAADTPCLWRRRGCGSACRPSSCSTAAAGTPAGGGFGQRNAQLDDTAPVRRISGTRWGEPLTSSVTTGYGHGRQVTLNSAVQATRWALCSDLHSHRISGETVSVVMESSLAPMMNTYRI